MRVLVACEFSGIVRDAFRKRGHDAWSCDLLECEGDDTYHIVDDAFSCISKWGWKEDKEPWDLMIAHPPCTYLAVSGARWFKARLKEQSAAVLFFKKLMEVEIPKIAVENPIGIMSTVYRKPDQIIQPWMFGHGETKATCLWLKGLPKLIPTNIVEGRDGRVWKEPPSPERWKNRSRTMQGIADAMAEQWGSL